MLFPKTQYNLSDKGKWNYKSKEGKWNYKSKEGKWNYKSDEGKLNYNKVFDLLSDFTGFADNTNCPRYFPIQVCHFLVPDVSLTSGYHNNQQKLIISYFRHQQR